MKKNVYVLTKGEHHEVQEDGTNKVHTVGDLVELTDAQYESFKDKFKSEGEHKAEVRRSKRVMAAIKAAEAEDAAEAAAEQARLESEDEDEDEDGEPTVPAKPVVAAKPAQVPAKANNAPVAAKLAQNVPAVKTA